MIETPTLQNLQKHIAAPRYRREDSFTNSAAYYALTGRRGSWICERPEQKTVICHHPNLNNHLLIFPEIGKKDGLLTANIIQSLDHSKYTVQLARFTEDEIKQVQRHLSKDPSLILKKQVEKTLDWQFPIHILDTERVALLEGAAFRNVRQKIRKIDEIDIQIFALNDPKALKYLKACTKYWEGNQILYNEEYHPDICEFYHALFSFIEMHPLLFGGFIVKYGARFTGFSIWDATNGETTNLIANLVDIHVPGLSEYQLVMACRLLHEKGVKYLNRGGSERESLNHFKKKFSPIKSISLYSATIEKRVVNQLSFIPFVQQTPASANYIFS